MSATRFPRLSERSRGWLRFIWDKATTPDDWSSRGEPHAWWDQVSTPPICAFPRFDLWETCSALPVLADITPAWREAYARIADELAGRHTAFWAAIDWLTLIGHDPNADRHPPEWLIYLPEHLRGKYDSPGWMANGIAPWGLQPDPIGADGNLLHRGFFNLVLSTYAYVSGDDKWERPFKVAGYQDRLFEWTHHRIAEFMHHQWSQHPEGPHCENTKIWPYCLTAAGLGMQLYDKVFGRSTHEVYDEWVAFARKHYATINKRGALEQFPFYYDPIEQTMCTFPGPLMAYAAIGVTPLMVPQNRQFAQFLYEASIAQLGWNDPSKPVRQMVKDPRLLITALFMARELGDSSTETRLRETAEREFEPRFFGEAGDRFGWWFHFNEKYPRGQSSAMMMLTEIGEPGAWQRVFNSPNLSKFHEPTLEGVDYPVLGIAQAWNDIATGTLCVETYAASPSRRGSKTTWRVARLPDPDSVRIQCDGNEFHDWRVSGEDSIEVHAEVGELTFRIVTGYGGAQREKTATASARAARGADTPAERRPSGVRSMTKDASEANRYVPSLPVACSCCASGAQAPLRTNCEPLGAF